MLRALPLMVLIGSILFLTAYGAGIYLWTVSVALILFSIAALLGRPKHDIREEAPASQRSLHTLYAILLLFLLVTLIPMPLNYTRFTGAHRFEQNQCVANIILAAKSLGAETTKHAGFSITRSRAGTLRALLLLATLFGGWFTARQLNGRQRLIWIRVLLTIGSSVAILGHIGKWIHPQGDTLWWLIPIPHGLPGPVAGFVNPNHFAGFIAMLAPVALITALEDARQKRWFFTATSTLAFSLMTLVMLFSLSRGAVVAYAGGIAILFVIFMLRESISIKIAMIAGVALLMGVGLTFALKHDQVRERLLSLRSPTTTASLQARMGAWRDTAGMLRRYPIAGAGANAFLVTYPQHRTSSSRAARGFAENEYVQIIGETGIIGTMLFILLVITLLKQTRALLADKKEPDSGYQLAAVAALAVAATHALVDFPMHLPLYAITVVTLAAFLWPAPSSIYPAPRAIWPHIAAIIIAGSALVLGDAMRLDSPSLLSSARMPTTTQALVWAPTSPIAWRRLSANLSQNPSLASQNLAEHCLTQAAIYDPNNYPLWRRLGDVRKDLGHNREANEAYRRVEALRDWIKLPVLPEE